MTELRDIASLEGSGAGRPDAPSGSGPGRRRGWVPGGLPEWFPGRSRARSPLRSRGGVGGRLWLLAWAAALVWSGASLLGEGHHVVNLDGWGSFAQFWATAVRPDLSPGLLRSTLEASLTTLAFAVLGTLLSILLGVVLAPFISQTWWAPEAASRRTRALRTGMLLLSRAVVSVPRGIHEAVWGLLLLSVLGRDPLVGVLAIAIPFGMITAKVYSELLDEADRGPYELLRAAGASRVSALAYGVLPRLLPTATSYAFYRFECSVRSAVVLGMIGVGGLGLQLSLSLQGLQYDAVWTSIYALLLLGAAIDRWGAYLRRRAGRRGWQVSGVVAAALTAASLWHLGTDVSRWFSARTLDQLQRLADDLLPPALPDGGWPVLLERSLETLRMSIVAITLAAGAGVLVCVLAARGATDPVLRLLGWLARQLLLLTRTVPPPLWALLILFLVYPGPLPGALALGVYTFGILGRLFAEVVEDLDRRPREAMTAIGATRLASFAYATVPGAGGQLIAYSLYRWEVTARESVLVGIVGAGGLGRLLEQQRAVFDFPGMAGTVAALVVVCLLVDLLSLAVRATLR